MHTNPGTASHLLRKFIREIWGKGELINRLCEEFHKQIDRRKNVRTQMLAQGVRSLLQASGLTPTDAVDCSMPPKILFIPLSGFIPRSRRVFAVITAGKNRLIRYDSRANGLSDENADEISFSALVRDFECVVDAIKLDHFAILGISQGAAIAIDYTIRHPDRVSKLVLHGASKLSSADAE